VDVRDGHCGGDGEIGRALRLRRVRHAERRSRRVDVQTVDRDDVPLAIAQLARGVVERLTQDGQAGRRLHAGIDPRAAEQLVSQLLPRRLHREQERGEQRAG
jgi:hypothetical protein